MLANERELSHDLVIRFLQALPEPYQKIPNQVEKVVTRTPDMEELLSLLKKADLLVKDYMVKIVEIEVSYLKEE